MDLSFRDRLVSGLLNPFALLILPLTLIASSMNPDLAFWGVAAYFATAAVLGNRRPRLPSIQPDVSGIVLHESNQPIPSRYRQWVGRADGIRRRIDEAVEMLSENDRALFEGLREQAADLARAVSDLAERATRITEHLNLYRVDEAEAQVAALDNHIENEADTLAREQLEQARAAAKSHLDKLLDLERLHARLVAEATNIEAHLNNVLAEVMLVHAGGGADAQSKDLLRLRSNIDALEQVIVGRRTSD